MPSQAEIRRTLTEQIIAALEQGVHPWRQHWTSARNTGRAANVVSQKPYRGLNPLLLEIHAHQHGFRSRWFGTYLQWQHLGCQVQKRPAGVPAGRWGAQIVFFKPITKTTIDPRTGEEDEETIRLLNVYTVFNADQVVGAERFQVSDTPVVGNTAPDFAPADELIEATGAVIKFGGDRAFYSPSGDYIQLPPKATFHTDGAYYETAFHELGHWSESRLDWHGSYAQNELIAEMAACFLAAELGVPNGEGLANHASYVKSWLDAMRGDHNYIFRASSQASKVADYLLSFTQQPEEVPAVEGELVAF
jgi:antirestriction protein ArdC